MENFLSLPYVENKNHLSYIESTHENKDMKAKQSG